MIIYKPLSINWLIEKKEISKLIKQSLEHKFYIMSLCKVTIVSTNKKNNFEKLYEYCKCIDKFIQLF